MTYEELTGKVIAEVEKTVIGKRDVVEKVFCAILAKGHILIEDIPGLGKTTMAMAFSQSMGLDVARVQFTPDVLPSDITGFTLYDQETKEMVFKPGPIFCNLFLADEINRTSPKSQSALLEVMEEGRVTIDGEGHELDKPFTVIATQNPSGSAGTQLLPESQLDRFMVRLSVGYPAGNDEIRILKSKKQEGIKTERVLSKSRLLQMQEIVDKVFIHDMIYKYIVTLIQATRDNENLELGASPRGGISLCKMASAYAFIQGRDYVIPSDVEHVFVDVVSHRIILTPAARMKHLSKEDVLKDILNVVPKPKIVAAK
ncbi:MAG: MoxR family ATPase [Lachnospiraceae bacterium]|nr:MoxR family ATPase [Lachnospiraceae bacterium]